MGYKKKQPYRATSLRLPQEDLTWLHQECTRIGITVSTAMRWLIARARKEGDLKPPQPPPETEN